MEASVRENTINHKNARNFIYRPELFLKMLDWEISGNPHLRTLICVFKTEMVEDAFFKLFFEFFRNNYFE